MRLVRVGAGEAKEPKVKMEKSITLGVTISIRIRPWSGITETSRAMGAGKEVHFLGAVQGYLIFLSVVLDPILFGNGNGFFSEQPQCSHRSAGRCGQKTDTQAHLLTDGSEVGTGLAAFSVPRASRGE